MLNELSVIVLNTFTFDISHSLKTIVCTQILLNFKVDFYITNENILQWRWAEFMCKTQ